MRIGSFWGLPAPMLLLAYDDVNDILNAVDFVRKAVNGDSLHDLHIELHYLLEAKNILITKLSEPDGGWFSANEPNAEISNGSIVDTSCPADMALIDLRNEIAIKLAQKIIDGEKQGKFVSVAAPVRGSLEALADDYVRSSDFSSSEIDRVVSKIYRSIKSNDAHSIASDILQSFRHESALPQSITRNGVTVQLSNGIQKIFSYFLNRMDDIQLLFESTVASHVEDTKVFGISASDFMRRKPDYLLRQTIIWFKYLSQNKHSSAVLEDTVNEYTNNFNRLLSIVSKAVAIEDSLQTESVNTEMYSVSVLLQHPEDYTEDELRAMNAVYEKVLKLTPQDIADKIGISVDELTSTMQDVCNYGIFGINDFSLKLFEDSLQNVILQDTASCKKSAIYLEQLGYNVSLVKDLLSNIKPLGATV